MAGRKLTRAELYELVWSEPARPLAHKLGLSDVGLAKICRRHRIPKPGLGYWAKVRHGKRVRRPVLPEPLEGEGEQVVLPEAPAGRDEESERVRAQRAYESDPDHRITVRDTLRGAHPLVLKTRDVLDAQESRRSLGYRDPRSRPGKPGCLDLHGSPAAARRALRIFDALIKASDARGFKVSVAPRHRDGPQATYVTVLGEPVEVQIEEPCRVEERPGDSKWRPVERVLVPTGRLVLRIAEYFEGAPKSWRDGTRRKVEDCLNEVMVSLVVAAEALGQRREEREAAERRWREAQERRRIEKLQEAVETARRQRLRSQASAWSEARAIRAFIAAAAARGVGPDGQEGDTLTEWLAWAQEYVAQLDPLEGGGGGDTDDA